jgi:hypothetical protein
MDEDQIDSARTILRIAAGLIIFGLFMALRHYFLVDQSPGTSIPFWFWFGLTLAVGVLVGAVQFENGWLEVYGVLIGAVCSLLGTLLYGLLVLYLFFAMKLWEDGPRSFEVLVARGPALMLLGYVVGAVQTYNIVSSFIRDLRSDGASDEEDDGD